MNKDIEVFILTRNRQELLSYSVESVLNQTHKVKLTVIDNNSEDTTQKYINSLMKEHSNLFYHRQDEFLPFEKNIKTAQELAEADYVMFFHDDDILHPQYIESAYKLINKYNDVDLITSLATVFNTQNEINHERVKEVKYSIFLTKRNFVSHCYSAFHTDNTSIMFPSVIYKTTNIKNIKIEPELYGKIADKPFVFDAIQNGKCIQIRDRKMLMYRVHGGQDSFTAANGPFLNEIFNHNKKFKEILNNNILTRLRFDIYSEPWIEILYEWGGNGKFSQDNATSILKEAYRQGAINKYAYNLICSPIRFLYKFFDKKLKKMYLEKDKKVKEYSMILGDANE